MDKQHQPGNTIGDVWMRPPQTQRRGRRDALDGQQEGLPYRPPIALSEALGPLREKLEAARAQREEARANYLGDCFDCNDTGFLWDDQPCRHCDKGKRQLEEQAAAAHRLYRALVIRSIGLPERCADFTFDSYPSVNRGIKNDVLNFVRSWDRKRGLFLCGGYGIGKTGLMVAALRYVADEYLQSEIKFASAPSLFRELRAGYQDNSYDRVLSAYISPRLQLLALDDLGAEKPSEWVQEQLYLIVNDRYDRGLPLWLTSNLSPDQIEPRIGERVTSRIMEMCEVVELAGKNLRQR